MTHLLVSLPTGFWTAEKITLFWENVRWFLGLNQMWIMIGVAVILAGTLAGMIVNMFLPENEDDEQFEYWDRE